MANPEVAIVIKAKDEASKVLSGIGSKLGGLGKFAAIGAAGIAGAAVGIGIAAFKIGADFDEAYDKIRVGTGATGEALIALKGDFKDVFADLPTDMGLASEAIASLNTRLGLTGEPLKALSKQMLELSRMTQTDLGMNIEQVTRVFGDWGVATKDQSTALDKLFRVSQLTGPPVEQIGRLMVQYGAPLRQMGFGFEEAAALMGKMEKEGVNTELVMGSLRIGLVKLAKEGEDPPKAFRRIITEIKNMGSVAKANELAVDIFGARAGPDMAAAIREGRFEIEDLVKSMGDAEGAIMRTSKETMDAGEKFTIMKNKMIKAFEPIASRLFDLAGVVMDKMMPAMESLAKWIDTSLVPAFDNLGRIVSPIKDIGVMLRDSFNKFFSKKDLMVAGLSALAVAFGILGVAAVSALTPIVVAAAPVIAIIAGIGAAALLLAKAWNENFLGIRDITANVFESITSKFKEFAEFVGPLIKPAMDNILNVITTVMSVIVGFFERHWDRVEKIFEGTWKIIQGVVKIAWAVVSGIIKVGLAVLAGDWDKAWTAMKDMLEGVWEGIKDIISGALNIIEGTLGLAWDAIADTARWAWEGIKGTILGVWEGIKSGIASSINWLIDRFNSFVDSVNKIIEGINRVPGISIPTLPTIGRIGEGYRGPGIPEAEYQRGGVVHGPIGHPVRAIVHGGEEIISYRERRRGGDVHFHFDFKGADLGGLTEERVEEIFREAALQKRLEGIIW